MCIRQELESRSMGNKYKKVCIIGGNSGIGKAAAKKVFESGDNVLITGTNLQKLDEAEKEIRTKNKTTRQILLAVHRAKI